MFPPTALWWLDHYGGLRGYLQESYDVLTPPEDGCVLVALR